MAGTKNSTQSRTAVRRSTVTRAEFEQLRDIVDDCCHTLDVQFKRFVDIQRELDQMKSAQQKLGLRK